MTQSIPRVYTIAPGGNFLQVLATEILTGFPLSGDKRVSPPLHLWTILLPTRRATRSLADILTKMSGKKVLLLPKIQPIGDIDLDVVDHKNPNHSVDQAISRTGQLLVLLDLLKDWATQNRHLSIAGEIGVSPIKSLALATSLLDLVDQMEVEETTLERIVEAYHADLSEHRNSILSLLGLLKVELPRVLHEQKLMGPSARRSLLIRLEAERIASASLKGPIIAAGSTGTIPATRHLLKAIANHPQGAVVLPGLDQHMANDDWQVIAPDHPQFTLRTLIASLDIERPDVSALGQAHVARLRLSSEIMRPSASTEAWHHILPNLKDDFKAATGGLRLLSARDRHIEARSIALILRHALEKPGQTAALVTPDRDLAQRVKSELLRWNINIDDSAGEPLINHGLASLAALVLQAITNRVTSADIISILSHADCTLGLSRDDLLKQLRHFEIVVLRGYTSDAGPDGWRKAFARALEARRTKSRVHSIVNSLDDQDWLALAGFVEKLTEIFSKFQSQSKREGLDCISALRDVLAELASKADWTKPENQLFEATLEQLKQEASHLKSSNSQEWLAIILQVLREQTFQRGQTAYSRLSIYGVLEARLLPADILILGGLNEGIWPSQPDPGPWLNRPMRTTFGMQQPERDIGVSAHDFTQSLGYKTVYITWSQRLQGSPQIPSRWILRLQTILAAAGLSGEAQDGDYWLGLAQSLDAVKILTPHGKPNPLPPVEARPLQFSVTEVEKLIRDPYAIYAKKILKLEPLPALSRQPDAALRGTLFHNALKMWNSQQPEQMAHESLRLLLAAGEDVFANLRDDPEVVSFWLPRFRRIATWLSVQEIELRKNCRSVFAEVEGSISFSIDGKIHKLTARADRIDILKDGSARILDYKSGNPPSAKEVMSGISPQLPLEAAILGDGGFKSIGAAIVKELIYVHITGANPGGELIYIDPAPNLIPNELAQKHLNGFKQLLAKYQRSSQHYLPRVALQREEDTSDYDHLSRHLEWMLAGDR